MEVVKMDKNKKPTLGEIAEAVEEIARIVQEYTARGVFMRINQDDDSLKITILTPNDMEVDRLEKTISVVDTFWGDWKDDLDDDDAHGLAIKLL